MLADLDHPFADGEPVYDVTFENVQAGLRTDYLFRLANHRGGIVLGTGDLSELALGLVHVRRRRPDVALRRQRRRPEDADPAPDPLGDRQRAVRRRHQRGARRDPRAGDHPRADPDRRRVRSRRRPRTPSGPTRCRTSRSSTCSAAATGRARSRSWPGTPGTTPAAGEWPPGLPARSAARPTTWPTIRHWLEVFCRRFFASQFKRSALPNGPKVSAGGTMSPRGDWRMPSDASATAWLAELEPTSRRPEAGAPPGGGTWSPAGPARARRPSGRSRAARCRSTRRSTPG